jgi:hypothetical protein
MRLADDNDLIQALAPQRTDQAFRYAILPGRSRKDRLKGVHLKADFKYFWTPPVSLQKAGIFKYETLGANFELAAKACDLNARLAAHRETVNGIKVKLTSVKPGSVGDLVRQFEAPPRYHRYSERAQQDYSWMYRSIEAQTIEGRMFGDMKASKITRQIAYEIYEHNVRLRGHDSANKAMSRARRRFDMEC